MTICAGPGTGLPNGFTIEWMDLADYQANSNTWADSKKKKLCTAVFSGNPARPAYNLAPDSCINVKIGEWLFDRAVSTDSSDPLACGRRYILRAHGNSSKSLAESDYTPNLIASTSYCDEVISGCTNGPTYWKSTSNPWPTGSLVLGSSRAYSKPEMLAILSTAAGANGLISLAHQLIAVKLNVASGTDGSQVSSAVEAADTMIGTRVIPPIGTSALENDVTDGLTTTLSRYNEGDLGVPHCG